MDQSQSHKPRLDRRNAAKNFEYTPSPSSSSSLGRPPLSRQTRSLDIPRSGVQTSLRFNGNDDELDIMVQSLGLSGPDDFDIPRAMWEAIKSRSSSDVSNRPEFWQMDVQNPREPETQNTEGVVDEISDSLRDHLHVNEAPIAYSRIVGADGIRGDRPPLLIPPAMSLPILDARCSTWDLMKPLAPDDSESLLGCDAKICPFYDDDDDVGPDVENTEQDGLDGAILGETVHLSELCSFTTSHEDDSSSSTTDPVSTISPNGRLKAHITKWENGELLGQGSFGKVYKAFSSEGFFFAVKEVSLLEQGPQGIQSVLQLEQEIKLLSQFEHENIVQYLGTAKDDSKLYIFLELVTQGSLVHLYQTYHLQDSQVSAYTRQILLGLKYLHDRYVVHRDIKCANILVATDGTVKLADFGLAKATKINDLKSCKGTAFWMAPEVVYQKDHGYGLPADIWSLGCTVLEMLTGHVPYHPLEFMQALFKIGKGIPPPLPHSLSMEARDFILQCLHVNPNVRPTAAELLDHSFVKRPLSTGSESPLRRGRWV